MTNPPPLTVTKYFKIRFRQFDLQFPWLPVLLKSNNKFNFDFGNVVEIRVRSQKNKNFITHGIKAKFCFFFSRSNRHIYLIFMGMAMKR